MMLLDLASNWNVYANSVNVEVVYFADCPHWQTAAARVRQVAAEVGAVVRTRNVATADAPGFAGSPTILVDGRDPFGVAQWLGGLSCRLYATTEGLAGSPTIDQLRTAITRGNTESDSDVEPAT
jgi:hypothetical protein